jgi:hypothetical protein
MSSSAELHVVYKIANAPIRVFPYPHILVHEVFPPDFYAELRRHLPPRERLKTLNSMGRVGSDYPETRLVLPLTPAGVESLEEPYRGFWEQTARWMLGGSFGQLLLSKFAPYIEQRFQNPRALEYKDEALLVQDYSTYQLGPHTDSPLKVMSLLFYLPEDDARPHLGTSIYVPRDPNFTCEGGPHYHFDRFLRMMTMPYVPNTLFAFLKTPNAFHGVEPIQEEVRRDLLLYDIKVKELPQQRAASPAMDPGVGSPVKFSF